jgi:hypothetical protein
MNPVPVFLVLLPFCAVSARPADHPLGEHPGVIIKRQSGHAIIDFKWRVTDAERAAYEAQVRRYAQVFRAIRGDKPVRLGLVTSDGVLLEVEH